MTPFFIDHSRRFSRLPLPAPHADPAAPESPAQYAQRTDSIEATVRELQAMTQASSKANLDAGRVTTVSMVGDRVPMSCSTRPISVSALGGTDSSR